VGVILDSLIGRSVWGEEFDEEEWFLDSSPEVAAWLKGQLGIEEGYFTAAAPERRQKEIDSIRSALRSHCLHK
jgi:hypothetical protein